MPTLCWGRFYGPSGRFAFGRASRCRGSGLKTGRKCRRNGACRTNAVQFGPNTLRYFRLILAVVTLLGATPAAIEAQTRREARGWLELEREQSRYRERVEPLTLSQQRQLETIERSQYNDLRALQQRQRRDVESDRRRALQSPNLDAPRPVPRPEPFGEQRRALERQQLQMRMRQGWSPFGNQ